MKNFLVNKILLLAFMLIMMSLASAQSLTYQSSFDFSSGATFDINQSVATEDTSPTDVVFSNDGMTVFTIGQGADEVNQYSLSSAFDITGGLTHEGAYSVTTEEGSPFSLTFNNDGTRFYIMGSGTDRVHQYSLSSPFDITSTVSLEGNYYVGLGNPNSLAFNSDGTRFYVGTTTGHQIHQYNLSNAFDVTSGTISSAGSSEALYNSVFDFIFTNNGSEIFVLNTTDGINHFSLSTAYDVSSTFTEIEDVFSVASEESNTYGIVISPSGTRLFAIGTSGDDINQYELNVPSYAEAISNDGSLIGSFKSFGLTGETFANPGGTLVYNTDYQISNLPAGLVPVIEISGNGLNGTLSFSGKATDHESSDDISSLTFTFNNSAFTGGDASSVTNAVAASSDISIDFRNNSTPIVAYGTLPNAAGATLNSSTFDVSSEDITPEGMAFNSDGTKVFVVGSNGDAVYEYHLSNPYDITSGVTYSDNSHAVGTEDYWPTGVRFSTDGLTMFVSGRGSNEINQYNLTSAFDLSGTITHQGTLDVSNESSIAHDLAFSPDGRTLMVCGPDIYQYSLTNPFDITTDVSYVGMFDQVQTIYSIDFGPDGTQILYTNSVRAMGIYDLEIPYDLSGDVSGGGGLSVLAQDNSPLGVTYSPDRKKLFMIGSANDQINQYAISPNKFEESFDDNGAITGSLDIRVIDDQFSNAGGSLVQGVDYSVSGLPTGLTSSLSVLENGVIAELTLSGAATSSTVADNISNLEFTFNNSAFVNSNVGDVINATGADSYFSINFKELDGQIFGSDAYQLTGLTFDNTPISVSAQTMSPYGIIFNDDGTKMFLGGGNESTIIQYTLTTPYDVSTASLEGTPLDVSADETIPSGIAFNNDGTKLYLIGIINDKLHQYSLGTPYDINGTVTHDGDLAFTNGIGVTFSSDGSRMFLTSNSLIYQYALNTPFDITEGASQVASAQTGSANSYSPTFSPNGKELFVMGGSHRVIYRFSLSNAFDITEGITSGESFGVVSQDTSPLSMTFSGDGKTVYVTGGVGDDINVYELPGIGFSEVSANSGALEGTYTLGLIGDAFVNATGNLSPGTHYTETGLPDGLSGSMSISGDGRTAVFSITGNATDHQNADDATIDLNIAFLNAAFSSDDASSIANNSFSISTDLDFDDNGSLSYSSGIFYEDFSNEGSVVGSMTVTITNETFSKTGLLTNEVDYSISGIPGGLTPELLVAGNKLSATLSLTGSADNHQSSDAVADLIISFENSAFTSTEALYISNAISESIGSISFDDNVPTITLGNKFDLSGDDPTQTASFSVADQDIDAGGMAFSNDGMKMFYVGYENDMIFEYHLTNAFDVSSGVTYSGNSYDISGETGSPSDLLFNPDGTIMFIMDGSGDEVEQYSLSVGYDLSSSVTSLGAFKVNTEDIQPAAITFSPNGRKMYMIGSSNDEIHQYTLSTPFDITAEVSYDEVEAVVPGRNWTDIEISQDGTQIFVSNSAFPGASYITQYDLNTPFDITGGISQSGSFRFHEIDYGPTDFTVSPDRKTLLVLGAQNDLVYQFALPLDGFEEVALNNGEVSGSLNIEIRDEQFSNAGGNFTHGSEYTINNLPAGLSPSVSVAADGQSATLTLSGASDAHQDINDVELEFSFVDAAFVNSLASEVQNATNANSTRSIDFRDNNPALSFGNTLDMDFATSSGSPLDVSSYSDYTSGIVFSNNGMKMFISVYGLGMVYEYSLSSPYDITSGASEVASYDHSAEDTYAEDLSFSADGTKMFVLGNDSYSVYQYNLTTPFDISSGVSYSGLSFNHEDYDLSIYAMAFNPDGSKLYLGGGNENAIMQFSLSTPFDLSSVSFDLKQLDLVDASPTGMVFSNDGRYLLITDDNTYQTIRYRLNSPYDMGQGGTLEETFDLDILSVWGSGISASPDGSKVFIADGDAYQILQYNINLGDFTETIANDGTVEGSTGIYLIDDTFSNAGGTLTHGGDYTINNLPAGLTPTLTVDADGYFAVLSLSGSADVHGDSDDIPSLQFTFNNSAFINYDAVDVDNSSNYNAGFGIDYSPYTENDIVSFTFNEINGTATINDGAHTVVAGAVAGTNISALSPTIAISNSAGISPDSGVEQDFSTVVTYTVTAEDGTPQDWDITVTEALAAPTDILLSNASIDENLTPNSVVGTFSTEDASFSETFTYLFISGDGDEDNTSFGINVDELMLTPTADFETKGSYNIRVRTDDGNGGLLEKAFIITINDVNEAPTDITLSDNTIDESNPSGTVVGSLSTTDEDAGQSYTYSMVPGTGDTDNDSFSISGSDLISAEEFDFEIKNDYSVRIMTDDGQGGSFEKEFSISVNDLPAQITSITLNNSSINENEVSGSLVGSFATFGEDLSGSFTYTLSTGAGDEDNASFSISGNQLLTSESYDFESKNSYNILVMSDDGNLSKTQFFNISVNDVSEAPTDILISANNITENNAIGEVIGSLMTTDEDAGETFTYSLVAGTGDNDNASFNVVGDELQAAEVFDFESKSSYSVRVETNDGNGGLYEEAFTIIINDENESILIVNPIADQNLLEDFTSIDIDLDTVFEDQDGDPLTYEVSSSNETIVTVSHLGTMLTISEASGFGSSTITVTADDGSGITNSDEFIVTVSNVNDAPVVANANADQEEDEGFISLEIDLSGTFSDEEGDNLTLSASSSNETVATASVSGFILTLTETGNGSSTITVTANDGNGGLVADEFTITVNNVNDAPVVANAIADQNENERFASLELDLSGTFSDEDGDNLTLSASSGDEAVVIVGISGNLLTLTETGNGSCTITVTANDGNGGLVADEFTITVNNVNDAPVVANAIADQNENEGFASLELDLSGTFSDEDGDNLTLSASSGDEAVVIAGISGNLLTLTETGNGSCTITVTANDSNGGTVSDEFTITVNNVNDAPVVVNPLGDQTALVEGFVSAQISYSDVFEDPDNDPLTISVLSSDENVATAEVVLNDQIQINETGTGTTTITVTADDGNGRIVSDEFIVTISVAPNNAPIVVNPLDDQTSLVEGFGSSQISYSDVFEDPDNDPLAISVSSSDESVATVDVVLNDQIQINEVGIGSTTITVTANDGNGGTVSDEFIVTISEAPNNAPVVANAISDQNEEEGFGSIQISYQSTFTDADGDNLTISVESSNESVITAELIANNQIQINEAGIGVSTITITADDGRGGSVSYEFIVTVSEAPLGFEEEIEVSVYPNPASDYLHIKSEQFYLARIVNTEGKELRRSAGKEFSFDISSLSSGVYLLILTNENSSIQKRIIKAN
ncbi:MAG: tandem-95 repeat protein [Cyclobacteriaceae bacterium]